MTVLGAAGAAPPRRVLRERAPSEVEDAARRAGIREIDWLVLDCGDDTRAARLRSRGEAESVVEEASTDAAELRHLGAPIVVNNSADATRVASDIVRAINALLRASRRT